MIEASATEQPLSFSATAQPVPPTTTDLPPLQLIAAPWRRCLLSPTGLWVATVISLQTHYFALIGSLFTLSLGYATVGPVLSVLQTRSRDRIENGFPDQWTVGRCIRFCLLCWFILAVTFLVLFVVGEIIAIALGLAPAPAPTAASPGLIPVPAP